MWQTRQYGLNVTYRKGNDLSDISLSLSRTHAKILEEQQQKGMLSSLDLVLIEMVKLCLGCTISDCRCWRTTLIQGSKTGEITQSAILTLS